MNEPKHTPGPWTIIKPNRRRKRTQYEHRQHALIVGALHGIALVEGPSNESREGEYCANARLIAAAPDLLAALRGLVRPVADGEHCPACGHTMAAHEPESDWADIDECPLMIARAAIRKATETKED